MKGNYMKPSELLQLLKETGQSYWDMIGRPLEAPEPLTREEREYLKVMERVDKIQPLPEFKGGKGRRRVNSGPSRSWTVGHQADWRNYLLSNGYSPSDAERLSGYFAAQDALESYGGTSDAARRKNNYGGMQKGGNNIAYPSKQAYMSAKLKMMQSRFKDAMNAQSMDEYATILGDPSRAGKNYLYYVTDDVKYNPKDQRWIDAQTNHMHNYINGMRYWAGQPSRTWAPINNLGKLQQKQNVVKQTQALLSEVDKLFGAKDAEYIPYVAPTYTPASAGVMQQRMPSDLDVLVNQRTFADYVPPVELAPRINIPISMPQRSGRSPLDMWREVNGDDYDDMYYFKRGKSYQFPFWNKSWATLSPPIKYGRGKDRR